VLILVELVDVSIRFKSFCALSFMHVAILQYFVMSFVFFNRMNILYTKVGDNNVNPIKKHSLSTH